MLKRRKLNYSAKKYSNPFFNRRIKAKRFSNTKPMLDWKRKAIIIALPVLIICFFAFYFFSSFFNIKRINIRGNQKIASSEIESIIWDQTNDKRLRFCSQKNINLFNQSQLTDKLKNLYYFETLSIDKDFPGTLNINVSERKYSLIWVVAEKYYYIDSEGNIFSEADPLEIKQEAYPLVEDLRGISSNGINVGVGRDTIGYILNLFNAFKEKHADIKINRFILDSDINTVKMSILNGPAVYFDYTKDADMQINKLMTVIKEKLKNDFYNKQYIDLRYGDRIYIK